MSERLRIYVSGPLSRGSRERNVRIAVAVGLDLIKAGFAPLVPHLTHFMDATDAMGHQIWLDVDLPWVDVCDGLLRIPGESVGADMEVARAQKLGLPIYTCVREVTESPPPSRTRKPGDARFHALLEDLSRLHARKSQDYGTGQDPFANIRASAEFGIPPYLGAILRANDKVQRLKAFSMNGRMANEGVEDSLADLASYALIALILYRESQQCSTSPTSRSCA